jgi:CPA2 family monovalent cation:H+ antiporter-2
MLLTPALFILYDKVIAPRFNLDENREADEITETSHVIIAGHGRVGGVIKRMLSGAGHTATVIDFSSKQLEMLAKFGVRSYFGDATRPELLASAGIAEAKLLIIAIDNKDQTTELARYMAHSYPDVHVIARAHDRNHVYDLWHVGCRDIVRETYDSTLRMGRSAYQVLGASEDQSLEMVDAYNSMDRKTMLEMAEHYDPDVPVVENETYMSKIQERIGEWENEIASKMSDILKK